MLNYFIRTNFATMKDKKKGGVKPVIPKHFVPAYRSVDPAVKDEAEILAKKFKINDSIYLNQALDYYNKQVKDGKVEL